MVTNIPATTTSTSTPPDPMAATTTQTTSTTTPFTTVPTTASTISTTKSTTPTTAPTTAAAAVQTTIPDTTYVIGNATTIGSTSAAADKDQTVLIVAITVSAAVCIFLIIAFCYLLYRRGENKRKQQRSLEMDSVFTPKNKRSSDLKSEVDPRLSTILEAGQSNEETINNSQSGSREHYINGKVTPAASERKEDVEPQYENLMTSKEPEEDNYIDPNVPNTDQENAQNTRIPKDAHKRSSNSLYEDTEYIDPNLPDTHQNDAEKSLHIPKSAEERDTDSFYENLQTTQSYSNMGKDDESAIYQNEGRHEAGESFYEEPIQKDNNDIYVDMA